MTYESITIPEETKSAMWQFFLKTSVPRLINKKRVEKQKEVISK